MANNEILQIVVFSMFFGVALAALGEKGKTLVAAVDELAHVMLKITGYVMKLAPLAVMAAMAATVAVNGLGILLKFAAFMGDFYTSLFMLWGLLILAGFLFLGPRVLKLLVLIRKPSCCPSPPPARSRLPEDPGRARSLRRQAQDLQLRDADGLFLQSGRLDDVLHLRDAVHRAGL